MNPKFNEQCTDKFLRSHPPKESILHVLKGQRKALEAGQYRIHKYKPGKFWLENGIGEGMETTEAKIEQMFADFFKREF